MICSLEVWSVSVVTLALILSPTSPFRDRWDFGSKSKFQLARSAVVSDRNSLSGQDIISLKDKGAKIVMLR